MHISLEAETVAHIAVFPITNSMIMTLITGVVLVVISLLATRKMSLVPKGTQNFMESIVEFLFNTSNDIIGDRKKTKKYFPLAATIFLFIILNNWLGLLPGVGTIGFYETAQSHQIFVPLLRSGNADLNTTLALAIIAIFAVNIFGITAIGFFKHTKRFLDFSSPINFFVGILELFSEISKMISFAFRLFGNIFAGEVLLTVMAVIVPYIAPLPFFGLELFVGLIQALVFTMLTLVFIKMAIDDHAEAH